MSEPIKINRSAKAFSMRELQEWLTAVRDSKYDPYWLDALAEFWNDEDMVLVSQDSPSRTLWRRRGALSRVTPDNRPLMQYDAI